MKKIDWHIFTSANTELVKEQIKEPAMCNAVNELFADQIKEKDLIIADKDLIIADKDAQLAAKDAIIAQLNAKLEKIAKKE